MDKETMLKKIQDIMRDKLDLNPADVLHDNDKLFEDLGINSVLILQLLVNIEEEFGFTLDEENIDINNLITINDLIDYIEGLLNDKSLKQSGNTGKE